MNEWMDGWKEGLRKEGKFVMEERFTNSWKYELERREGQVNR